MLAQLQEQVPDLALPPRCQITWIHYAGDEGGIVCKLDFGNEDDRAVVVVSITYLVVCEKGCLGAQVGVGVARHA
jgi:hypothetical protein